MRESDEASRWKGEKQEQVEVHGGQGHELDIGGPDAGAIAVAASVEISPCVSSSHHPVSGPISFYQHMYTYTYNDIYIHVYSCTH